MRWLLLLMACQGEKSGPTGDSAPGAFTCNPVAPAGRCLLPFPSDVWRGEDGIAIPDSALPVYDPGGETLPVAMNPFLLHPARGYSPVSTILAGLDVPLDEAPLIGYTEDPALTLQTSSPTLLIEADTGALVPHFAELDAMAEADTARVLVIHPLVRLRDGARYVVALHDLVDTAGALAPPTAGFAEARAGEGPLSDRYAADVLPVVAATGLALDTVQLAWDFTVREQTDATGDMLQARSLALAALDAEPVRVTITSVEDGVDGAIARQVKGTLRAPLVLEEDAPLALLHRDADGAVALNGWVEVPFTANLPVSDVSPLRVIQFGHGFFGDQSEMEYISRSFGPRTGSAFFAIDWVGMSHDDLVPVASGLANDMGHGLAFTDRVHQAMVNQLTLSRALATTLPEDPAFQNADGQTLIEVDHRYFYGISMGHILGGVYAALAPDIDRVALGSGGASFSLMMMRALPFLSFAEIVLMGVDGSAELLEFSALSQTTFDRIDPGVYAPYVIDAPLPGSPAGRQVLIQMGIGDAQVPNVGTHLHARMLGLPLLSPTARSVYGLEEAPYPQSGSGLVEYDFGYEAPLAGDVGDLNAAPNEVHGAVRELPVAQLQVAAFLSVDGQIIQTCDGVCDPE